MCGWVFARACLRLSACLSLCVFLCERICLC